jgi:hypothetical protein
VTGRLGDGVAALAPLGRPAVEVAIEQASFGEIRAVLAYAEGFAVVAAGLGVVVEVAPLVLTLVDATIAGTVPWRCVAGSFPLHLRRALGLELGARLHAAALAMPAHAGTGEPSLAAVQVGSLRGLVQGARLLGDVMTAIREDDHSTVNAATALHAAVRTRLLAVLAELDAADDRARRGTSKRAAPVVIDLDGWRPGTGHGGDDNNGPN